MVDPQWNSKVQRSNAIRLTAKQTIDDTSRSRTIIGDGFRNSEVNKMRNYSGAAMAPLRVSLVSEVRSMRIASPRTSSRQIVGELAYCRRERNLLSSGEGPELSDWIER
jgi:hypothetical protein